MHKTKRMKNLILFTLLIFTIGCICEHSVSLSNDPIVNKYFNEEEIEGLVQILNFFEDEIAISSATDNVIDSYELFFENIKPEMKLEEFDSIISFGDQKKFLTDLNPILFNEIWFYKKDYNPILKDTVESIHYKWKGKYFDFLYAVSEKDKAIEEYFEDFTAAGYISPSILAYSMMDYKKYDLKLERIRLIIAINYLTFNEQLRLIENQREQISSVHNKSS